MLLCVIVASALLSPSALAVNLRVGQTHGAKSLLQVQIPPYTTEEVAALNAFKTEHEGGKKTFSEDDCARLSGGAFKSACIMELPTASGTTFKVALLYFGWGTSGKDSRCKVSQEKDQTGEMCGANDKTGQPAYTDEKILNADARNEVGMLRMLGSVNVPVVQTYLDPFVMQMQSFAYEKRGTKAERVKKTDSAGGVVKTAAFFEMLMDSPNLDPAVSKPCQGPWGKNAKAFVNSLPKQGPPYAKAWKDFAKINWFVEEVGTIYDLQMGDSSSDVEPTVYVNDPYSLCLHGYEKPAVGGGYMMCRKGQNNLNDIGPCAGALQIHWWKKLGVASWKDVLTRTEIQELRDKLVKANLDHGITNTGPQPATKDFDWEKKMIDHETKDRKAWPAVATPMKKTVQAAPQAAPQPAEQPAQPVKLAQSGGATAARKSTGGPQNKQLVQAAPQPAEQPTQPYAKKQVTPLATAAGKPTPDASPASMPGPRCDCSGVASFVKKRCEKNKITSKSGCEDSYFGAVWV